ncbi:MAG: hypothetical protein LBD59_00550 [Prevotellaceae bacterium]|jgi:hypothetical protein|nr:hypothetical protein [Prevotellaceae bacterium]
MNKIYVLLFSVLLGVISCQSNMDEDIDMSLIDFSNIENLYAQPLPVIQKAVQGKWKWMTYISGFNGSVIMDNGVVEISKNEFKTYKGVQRIVWQEREVELYMGIVTTHVMCENPGNVPICCFEHIKNDTMRVSRFQFHFDYHEFIRIKNN